MGVWTFVSPSSLSSPVSQQMDDSHLKKQNRATWTLFNYPVISCSTQNLTHHTLFLLVFLGGGQFDSFTLFFWSMLSFVRVRGWMPTGQRDTTGWWTESTETGTGSLRLIGNPSLSTNMAARYPLTLRTHVWTQWLGTFIILLNPVSCFFSPDYVCLMLAKQIHF